VVNRMILDCFSNISFPQFSTLYSFLLRGRTRRFLAYLGQFITSTSQRIAATPFGGRVVSEQCTRVTHFFFLML